MIVQANRSLLLLIDLQSKLVPAIEGSEACLQQCRMLLSAARTLNVPIRATEHCPVSVGLTVPELRDQLAADEIFSKTHFDGSAEPLIQEGLKRLDRPTIVICGTEAHVCVLQTVLGLKGRGFEPVLVADATASRRGASHKLAIERMRDHGVDIVSTEMVMFEWLKVAGTPEFKTLLPMIKSGKVDR